MALKSPLYLYVAVAFFVEFCQTVWLEHKNTLDIHLQCVQITRVINAAKAGKKSNKKLLNGNECAKGVGGLSDEDESMWIKCVQFFFLNS